jgi:flagellar biosynthesis/type III secretory pathway M-ring protein FliF/YscJ
VKLPRLPKNNWARLALAAIVILVVWTLVATVVRFFSAPREAARQKAEAITAQESTKATGAAASAALETVTEVRREVVRIDATTRRNDHAIKTAAGAGTRAPGVAAALHDSLCRRASYSGEPDCASVLANDRGVGLVGSDAGGAAAAD